jgi:hypothetical protein
MYYKNYGSDGIFNPGSMLGATSFSKKQWVWKGVHSASRVQLRSYLKENVAVPVSKTENTAVGISHADHVAPSIRKSWLQLCRQAAVAPSVELTRGLRPRSLVLG